jgi:hypothetical protein
MNKLAWFALQAAIIGGVVYSALVQEPPEGIGKERGIALALVIGVALAFAFTWMITSWIEIVKSALRKFPVLAQRFGKGGRRRIGPGDPGGPRHKLIGKVRLNGARHCRPSDHP